jgi:uncharacterized protein YdhG (YjbR/CyaY superfamily)
MAKSKLVKGNPRPKRRVVAKQAKTKTLASPDKETTAVVEYMRKLDHPLKDEVQEVRRIIKGVDHDIRERIKWNAPSYHYKGEDMVTFNLWAKEHVHLVFHHPAIVKVLSPMLEGQYEKRRMTYFTNMAAVKRGKKELVRIIKQLLELI